MGCEGAPHPKKGQSAGMCSQIAQGGAGAKSYDEFGTACWQVYGKSIQLNPAYNSVMEGAMITNINFNAGVAPAIASAGSLGASIGYKPGV